jgi:preprotein translocase subunit YajC
MSLALPAFTALPTLQASPPQPSILEAFLPMAVVFGIFYVLVIGPSRKKQAQQDALLKNLKAGDKVLLASGIYGVIESLDGASANVRIAEKTRVRVQRSAIASLDAGEAEAK